MIDEIINFFVILLLVVSFILIALSFFYILIDKVSSSYNSYTTNLSNKSKCAQIKALEKKMRYTTYFWSNPTRFIWINIIFAFLISITLSLYNLYSLVLASILFVGYIFFLYWSYQSYKNFPKIAKQKLEEFEKAIKEGIKKEISLRGETIQTFKDSFEDIYNIDEAIVMFEFPKNVTKFDFPPFETNAAKKSVISTRKLEFLIVGKDFVAVCDGATEFNLLYPKRGDEKKGCAELKGAGGCKEYYYSKIDHFEIKDDTLYAITHKGEEIKLIAGGKVKDAIKLLRDRLRVVERQRLNKIDELYKYKNIRKLEENDKNQNKEQEEEKKE